VKSLGLVLGGIVAVTAGLLVACQPDNWGDDETGSATANVEAVDPLEGAYIKQGGTQVNFIFKRGESDADKDTFLGEIEVDGEMQRAQGTVVVGMDNLGTKLTLAAEGMPKTTNKKPTSNTASDAGSSTTTGDAGAAQQQPTDNRPIAQQAFNGTMHFLRIGKNSTILVRGDANGKTAHYKKVKTWCAEDADCASDVQNTGLDCTKPKCSSKSTCSCSGSN
jgi:hypothetical protein